MNQIKASIHFVLLLWWEFHKHNNFKTIWWIQSCYSIVGQVEVLCIILIWLIYGVRMPRTTMRFKSTFYQTCSWELKQRTTRFDKLHLPFYCKKSFAVPLQLGTDKGYVPLHSGTKMIFPPQQNGVYQVWSSKRTKNLERNVFPKNNIALLQRKARISETEDLKIWRTQQMDSGDWERAVYFTKRTPTCSTWSLVINIWYISSRQRTCLWKCFGLLDGHHFWPILCFSSFVHLTSF